VSKEPLPVVLLGKDALVRSPLVDALERAGEVEVLGRANDAAVAARMCKDRRPRCALLFCESPAHVELLGAVLVRSPLPVVVVAKTASLGVQATAAGAVEALHWEATAEQVATSLRLMTGVAVISHRTGGEARPRAPKAATPSARLRSLVLVGTSTGGPPALVQLFGALPQEFAVPIVLVQHMPDDYHGSFVEWLSSQTALPVRLAQAGTSLEGRGVFVAPGGANLVVGPGGYLLSRPRSPQGPCPSVDALFESAAQLEGFRLCAVVMTGMGSDGAKGLLAVRQAGGYTLVQDRASSVVFGMPAAALELGAADLAFSPHGLAEQLRFWALGGEGAEASPSTTTRSP
jgi:two-component system chemotaxis response regulator CheB